MEVLGDVNPPIGTQRSFAHARPAAVRFAARQALREEMIVSSVRYVSRRRIVDIEGVCYVHIEEICKSECERRTLRMMPRDKEVKWQTCVSNVFVINVLLFLRPTSIAHLSLKHCSYSAGKFSSSDT